MTFRTKLRYRHELNSAALNAASKILAESNWFVRVFFGTTLLRYLMLAFVEGCEWQDEQKYGD